MSVRLKIALTILLAGLFTAMGVVVVVVLAFQRFENESAYQRAHAFLQRVASQHPEMLETQRTAPEDVSSFLRNLVLYEPDVSLYLLDAQGRVLASSGDAVFASDERVPLAPVQQATRPEPMTYVMGVDPADPSRQVIVAARPMYEPAIRPAQRADGYLYLVCLPTPFDPARMNALLGTVAQPGLLIILLLVVGMAVLAAWVTATITRPLARLTAAVRSVTREGLDGTLPGAVSAPLAQVPGTEARDEFGQLARGMDAMLQTLRLQWGRLRRLDHFRREGVSNLSHDLRSPLTATVACLETLENQWAAPGADASQRELLKVALRNTHNAARMVRSLGDLALLDEPEFKLHTSGLDMAELLGDVAMRFAARAQARGVTLVAQEPVMPVVAEVDNELLERALANLVDNALKFCGPGAQVLLSARSDASRVMLTVQDSGPGIAPQEQAHLFDRFYQARQSTAPATGEGGKGLGLAIVKRIAELHGGTAAIDSLEGRGTAVTLTLPTTRTRHAA
jgi:signal transduction histidine kinase